MSAKLLLSDVSSCEIVMLSHVLSLLLLSGPSVSRQQRQQPHHRHGDQQQLRLHQQVSL